MRNDERHTTNARHDVSEPAGSMPVYSIGAVSRMVGVAIATIRGWEDRYGIVLPHRSAAGHRLYSREQVEQLKFIAGQVETGLSPGDAHRLLDERVQQSETSEIGPGNSRRRLVILLAERDRYAAELAEFFLRTEGYDVNLSFDPLEAREVFEQLSPDLVVIEWLIAGGAGARLCRDLKERSDRPILVISPLAIRDAAIQAGADAFLLKPLDPLRFVSTVKDLLLDSAFIRAQAPVTA
jgi:DNA-binding transcriptional MerR regulator